ELFEELRKKGFLKVRVDGEIRDLSPKMQVDRYKIHDIELVVDRLKVTKEMRTRISQSVQQSLKLGKDLMFVGYEDNQGKKGEAYTFRQVQTLARKNKFSLDKPLKDLPQKALNLVLYGKEDGLTGDELQFNDEEIEVNVYSGEFEGVVNQVKRWFATSTSEVI